MCRGNKCSVSSTAPSEEINERSEVAEQHGGDTEPDENGIISVLFRSQLKVTVFVGLDASGVGHSVSNVALLLNTVEKMRHRAFCKNGHVFRTMRFR